MGNTRQFRAGRRQKVLSQKERIKQLTQELGYTQGLLMATAAELEATKMERPADLDEWVDSIVEDMDEGERSEWDSMDEAEKAAFKDKLAERINRSKALLD